MTFTEWISFQCARLGHPAWQAVPHRPSRCYCEIEQRRVRMAA